VQRSREKVLVLSLFSVRVCVWISDREQAINGWSQRKKDVTIRVVIDDDKKTMGQE
jgi:hypothetical protein